MISPVRAVVWAQALTCASHTPTPCRGRAEGTARASVAVAKLLSVMGSDLETAPQAS